MLLIKSQIVFFSQMRNKSLRKYSDKDNVLVQTMFAVVTSSLLNLKIGNIIYDIKYLTIEHS